MTSPIIYEPFWASFTGQLSVYYTKEGHRCVFQRPYPRIVHGTGYMFKVNLTAKTAQLLTLVEPE